MANISEQCACVYVRGTSNFWGGQGKKKSKHIYRLQLYGFGQLLGITGLNLSLMCPHCKQVEKQGR